MTAKLTVLRGLPGSGKSTWAESHVATDPEQRVVVSRDGLRKMLSTSSDAPIGHEDHVTAIQQYAVRELLRAGKEVLVDDTNLPHRRVRQWLGVAEEGGAEWEVVDFTDVPLETCLERNAKRSRVVPEDVILRMNQKFIAGGAKTPATWEPLGSTVDVAQGAPYAPDTSKPRALIVDIDGTVAKMNGRSPYDYSLVGEDLPNTPILDYVSVLADSLNAEVVFVSGRPESCREDTEEWLSNHVWDYHALYMRSDEEHQKQVRDDKVKLRLFNEHIRHNYNVHSVLDDRSRVVKMWRGLGLTVLQVDDGNF